MTEAAQRNGSVLLIDNDPGLRDVLGEYLHARGFHVIEAEDAAQGLQRFRVAQPSVVFLDSAMSEDETTEVLLALAKEAPDVPVVIILRDGEPPSSIGKIELSAYEILPRPVSHAALEHAVRHVQFQARLNDASRAHLRYLERRNVQLDVRLHELEKLGIDLQRENRQRAKTEQAILRQMRSHEETELRLRTVQAAFDGAGDPILITSADRALIYSNAAFDNAFGAGVPGTVYDLRKVFRNPAVANNMIQNVDTLGNFSCEVEMVSATARLFPALVRASTIRDESTSETSRLFIFTDITEQEQLRRQAYHDALTGLYSRRHLMDQLKQSMSLARRHAHPLSLCLCDLDKFKQINDTYGHNMGDKVLESFANVIREEIRTEDIGGRLGGDEFCIVFPYAHAEVASICLERIRRKFERIPFETDDGKKFHASATFGVADMLPPEIAQEAFTELADQSLYAAKELGRNCVVANGKKML